MIKKGNKRITITLTPYEQKALEVLAEEEDETITKLITRLIRMELNRYNIRHLDFNLGG